MDKNKPIFVNCILCSKDLKDKDIDTFFHKELSLHYTLFYCKNCDIQFWYPLELPQGTPFTQQYDSSSQKIKFLERLFTWLQRFILGESWNLAQFLRDKKLHGGDLLDVGFGDARFLKACKKLGYNVYGIEVDRASIDIAERAGIESFWGTIEQFVAQNPKAKATFDYITCFETLEHLTDPASCLRHIWFLLKPGGKTIISVPCRDRTIILPEHGDEPPGHFTKWSICSLHYALENTGFKVDKIAVQPLTIRYMIGCFFRSKLLDILPQEGIWRFIRAVNSFFLAFLCFLPLKLRGGRGWHLYAVAVKR